MFWSEKYENSLYQSFEPYFDELGEPLIKQWLMYQLKWYGNRAWTYRLYSRIHTGLSLAGPALASIGMLSLDVVWIKCLIMIINAISIIVLGILTSMRCTEQWIRYRTICEKLKLYTIEYLHETQQLSDERDRQGKGILFLESINQLIGDELDEWSKLELKRITEEKENQKVASSNGQGNQGQMP